MLGFLIRAVVVALILLVTCIAAAICVIVEAILHDMTASATG